MNPAPSRALVVEDDPSWQLLLSEILTDTGLGVDISDHPEDAIERIRQVPYRLVIVDLSLSGEDPHNQDGLQVLKAVQLSLHGCPSVLLTGYASVELAVSAIQEYGALTCLRKENFRRGEFVELIQQALAAPVMTENGIQIKAYKPAYSPTEKSAAPGGDSDARLALIVEDDAGWRGLLAELLGDSGYQVHVSAGYGEAQGLLKRHPYQLAIVDISLASSLQPNHNQDGYRLLNSIRQARIPTVVVSGFADPDLIDQAYAEFQIFACFEKQSFERRAFVETIRQVSNQDLLLQNLTAREMEVLSLVAHGLSNKEIAAELFISTNTVKRHLKSIFTKLEVNSRAAASAYAIRIGLTRGASVQGG